MPHPPTPPPAPTHPHPSTCRSILPCQDSPGAKFTYSAAVRVPAALRALMSAVPQEQQQEGAPGGDASEALQHLEPAVVPGTKIYRFK